MRCESCAKFVSLENGDPEVNDLDITSEQVTCNVRLVRTCADCSGEMKEANLDLEDTIDHPEIPKGEGDKHEFDVEEDGAEVNESGGGRYKKNMIGVEVSYKAKCSCGWTHEGTLTGEEAAGSFEELC